MKTALTEQQNKKLRKIFRPPLRHRIALRAILRALRRSNKQLSSQCDELEAAIDQGNIAEITRIGYLYWQELYDTNVMLLKESDDMMRSLLTASWQAQNLLREWQKPKQPAA